MVTTTDYDFRKRGDRGHKVLAIVHHEKHFGHADRLGNVFACQTLACPSRPRTLATAEGTSSGSDKVASSISKTFPSKSEMRSRAVRNATVVLPIPPGPHKPKGGDKGL